MKNIMKNVNSLYSLSLSSSLYSSLGLISYAEIPIANKRELYRV